MSNQELYLKKNKEKLKMQTFEQIRNEGRLLYEYIRGSHLYNLNVEGSDVDTGGLFFAPFETLLSDRSRYEEQVTSKKHDDTWHELGRFTELLKMSNPNILEALFVPKEKMIVAPHKAIMPLFENKEMFVTKKCFNSFIGYSNQQILKARGLNKKFINPVKEKLSAFDFIYTFYKQGSTKIANWLDNMGLEKEFCGMVSVPNMHDVYGLYYDWGAHFNKHLITYNELMDEFNTNFVFKMFHGESRDIVIKNANFIKSFYHVNKWTLKKWFDKNSTPIGYRGMILEDSCELRSSSVSKGEMPLCHVTYNRSGYSDHCKRYKEYKEWEENRNPVRYESNLNHNYDSKNIAHAIRLMHMGKEIAKGEGVILERTWDRQFILDVKAHKYEYEELIDILSKEKMEMETAIAESTIPTKIDDDFLNELLISIRKELYCNKI